MEYLPPIKAAINDVRASVIHHKGVTTNNLYIPGHIFEKLGWLELFLTRSLYLLPKMDFENKTLTLARVDRTFGAQVSIMKQSYFEDLPRGALALPTVKFYGCTFTYFESASVSHRLQLKNGSLVLNYGELFQIESAMVEPPMLTQLRFSKGKQVENWLKKKFVKGQPPKMLHLPMGLNSAVRPPIPMTQVKQIAAALPVAPPPAQVKPVQEPIFEPAPQPKPTKEQYALEENSTGATLRTLSNDLNTYIRTIRETGEDVVLKIVDGYVSFERIDAYVFKS